MAEQLNTIDETAIENKGSNTVSRNMWIKLTGPAAQSLAKAFLGQALLLLQENKGAKRGAEEEDATIMVTPLGQEAENKVLEVTGRGGTTARVKTVSGKSHYWNRNNNGRIFVTCCPQVKQNLKNKRELKIL